MKNEKPQWKLTPEGSQIIPVGYAIKAIIANERAWAHYRELYRKERAKSADPELKK